MKCSRCKSAAAGLTVDVEPLRDFTPDLIAKAGLKPGHDVPLCWKCAFEVIGLLGIKEKPDVS